MNPPSAAPEATITLEIHICDQRRSYRVVFTGPDAQAHALAFLDTRSSTHAFHELESAPIDASRFPLLYDYLNPLCEHGMSLSNCYGPQHFYFDEEEQARGMRNG
jgi:hypothetical protein